MKKLSKKDVVFSIITGAYTGLIAWLIADFLGVKPIAGISYFWLTFVIPIAWICGISLGYFLGSWLKFFNQFGKFAVIGFVNFSVDTGVLYLLIAATDVAAGPWYSVFKTISFIVGVTHSYFWNKFWVFESSDAKDMAAEATKFFAVMLVSAAVNVAVASFFVNFVPVPLTLDAKAWAGLSAVIGSATALVVSFVGFRVVVFKR